MTKFRNVRLFALSLVGMIGFFSATSCADEVICPDCVTLPTVTIELEQSEDYSQCRVLFTPVEGTDYFSYFLGAEGDLTAFEDGSLEGVESLHTDRPQEVIFYDLQIKQEYVLYARAFNADGKPGGTAVARFFNGQKLKLEPYYVTNSSAGVEIRMGDGWSRCRYYMGEPQEKEAFLTGQIPGDTLVDADRFIVNRFDLEPDRDYALYAVPVNRMGVEYSVMEYTFHTYADGQCADVTLDFPVLDVCLAQPRLTPNGECGTISACISLSSTEDTMVDMPNSELLDFSYQGDAHALFADLKGAGRVLTSYNGNPLVLEASLRSLLECERELELLVMMQHTDGTFAGVKRLTFATPERDDSAGEATASVEIVDIVNGGSDWGVSHQVKALIHPNEHTLGYFVKFMGASEYEQAIQQEDGENKLREQMMNDWSYTVFVYGPQPYAYINDRIYSWYTENYIIVCPFNANGREGWGPITAEYFEIK